MAKQLERKKYLSVAIIWEQGGGQLAWASGRWQRTCCSGDWWDPEWVGEGAGWWEHTLQTHVPPWSSFATTHCVYISNFVSIIAPIVERKQKNMHYFFHWTVNIQIVGLSIKAKLSKVPSRDARPAPWGREKVCPAPQKGGFALPRPSLWKLPKPVGRSGAKLISIHWISEGNYREGSNFVQ